ncbi:CotH kinase family protein [Mycobacterium sp. NPDC050853]|uniref:CotH kinase family protein n=1 Tax=Mycobacterium sp. NPDC050853 TaxID=3155160 RepID=UPI0034087AA3
MSAQQQQALDRLYAIDNVLTIKVTMPQDDWDALRTEQPKGGVCNFEWTGDARFTWRRATAVEISGTKFPDSSTFNEVGLKKKSFCGSLNSEKPCLHIDFGKFRDTNTQTIESLIGSRYLTLNNSIQDRSFIRQPLGYRLLAKAGLPHSRCNYAKVFVNGTLIGQGVAGVNAPGFYVNAEPVMKRYIERNFNGNMKGNLYEIEHHDDFVRERLQFIGVESLSEFENMADLKFAMDHIAAQGISGAAQMLDLDQFIKFYAMEFYLKHWDGYADNTNNTYIYNDVAAVEAPGVNDVKFKMIPWGIDQTFQPDRPFTLGSDGLIGRLVRNDSARRTQLMNQIRTFRETVFGREVQQKVWRPFIDQLQALLVDLNVPNAVAEISTVRQQLRLAESAGYLCAGLPDQAAVYILHGRTGECLHASNTESVPPSTPNPQNFEVYRLPVRDDNDPTDVWLIAGLGNGKSLTNKSFDRVLHASNSLLTPEGNKFLYTCAPNNIDRAEEFAIVPADSADEFTFSGYFRLRNLRTDLAVAFGESLTPGGRVRVHQEPAGSRLYFY